MWEIPLRRPNHFMAARWQQYDNARQNGAKRSPCTKSTLLQLYDSYLTWERPAEQVKSEKIVFSWGNIRSVCTDLMNGFAGIIRLILVVW